MLRIILQRNFLSSLEFEIAEMNVSFVAVFYLILYRCFGFIIFILIFLSLDNLSLWKVQDTMDGDIGTFCRQVGVTLHKLKSDDPCILEEPLCNGAAVEILNLVDNGFCQEDIYLTLKKIYTDNPAWNEPSKTALLSALHRAKTKIKRLKKDKASPEAYLNAVFLLPKRAASKDGCSKTKCTKRKHVCEQCSCLETTAKELAMELQEQSSKAEKATLEAEACKRKVTELKRCLKMVKQTVQRKKC